MPFRAICPSCQATYKLPDAMNGKKVRCAKCSNTMVAAAAVEAVEYEVLEEIASEPVHSPPKAKASRALEYEDDEERDAGEDRDLEQEEQPRKQRGTKEKKRKKKSGQGQFEVDAVAFFQKAILLCILGNIVAGVLWRFLPPVIGLILWLPVIAVGLASTVFAFMLARALYGKGLGILIGILTLVPGVGLITLLIMNQGATRFLRNNGVEVGFLGAKGSIGSRPPIDLRVLAIVGGIVLVVLGGGLAGAFFFLGEIGGPWPELPEFPQGVPGSKPDEQVLLHISGVGDQNTYDAIYGKLRNIGDSPAKTGTSGTFRDGRMTARVSGISDPQAAAKRIDFGTVVRISGRTITVEAHEPKGEK